MKIGLRILLGYFLIVGLAAWFLLAVFQQEVKPGVRATQEDALVDTAHLLAAIVADDVKAGTLADSVVISRIDGLRKRQVDVRIAGFARPDVALRVYITDASGVVIYDSSGKDVGRSYARWNDVYRTLRGQYGARSTRAVYDDDGSSVMHVAAPIKDGDRIIGVLTVAKPNSAVQPFVERSQQVIRNRGALLLLMSLLIGAAFAWWLSHSLNKLMGYIAAVEAGRKVALPELGKNEFGRLGRALAAMRDRLEGKEYVEELMHTMAHELKSPIAAIQGSAELMREEMPAHERARFLANILNQNARQKQLIDKLLALIRVEKQQHLQAPAPVSLAALAAQAREDCAARLAAHGLTLALRAEDIVVAGDALLLRQAIGNLLDNAIDFSPAGSAIELTVVQRANTAVITVRDHGSGIPEFARERLFERFYSLPRADGTRSTGLGLPFVREAVALHRGSVQVDNGEQGGAVAVIVLPLV